MDAIGRNCWAIAEDHIHAKSSFNDRALVSHETACILKAGGSDADVALTICRSRAGRALSQYCASMAHTAYAFQRS